MAFNVLSLFRNFGTPQASASPWSTASPQRRVPTRQMPWRQRHVTPKPMYDGAELMNRAAQLAPPPQARTSAATTNTDVFTDAAPVGGAGWSMPDLDPEAWAIVNAAIAKQKGANQAAREAAMVEYENMKREYELASQAQQGTISGQAADDRAKLNNMMAARGIGAGEAAAMNFGRFDQATQDRLAQAIAQYTAQTMNARQTADQRVNALIEQDRLLDEGAPAEALAVMRQLQGMEIDRARAEWDMRDEAAMGGSNQQEMWASIGADAVSVTTEGGLRGNAALRQLNAIYAPLLGMNIEDAAARGDVNAQRIIQLVGFAPGASKQPPATGGYTDLRTGVYTPRFGSAPVNTSRLYNPNYVTSSHR